MSEEVLQAAGDIAYWQRRAVEAEAAVAALRKLDQLDQALEGLTVTEIDSARARIDTDLVPQLARMLAFCMVKADGTPYNVVTWALGSAEPFGAMELILQRTEGKTPTQLRIEAEADAAAIAQRLIDWIDADGTMEFADADEDLAEFARSLRTTPRPGASLLAELDAARRVVALAREWREAVETLDGVYAAEQALLGALKAIDKELT